MNNNNILSLSNRHKYNFYYSKNTSLYFQGRIAHQRSQNRGLFNSNWRGNMCGY